MTEIPILEIRSIHMSYGQTELLRDVNLEVLKGEILALVGPNGAGKSTLLNIISGIIKPDHGDIKLDTDLIDVLSPRERALQIAMVKQTPSIPYYISVFDFVMLGRNPHLGLLKWESDKDIQAATKALELTNTDMFWNRRLGSLSGGEQQRVSIARALTQEPTLLLLDEPTANLDIKHQLEIMELIKKLSEQGLTTITALHDLSLASRFCNRIALLHSGNIMALGAPFDVLTKENLEDSFSIRSLVYKDPITDLVVMNAFSIMDNKKTLNNSQKRIHIICGGGSGSRLMYHLADIGFTVTAGVLSEWDSDYHTAQVLNIDFPHELPFIPIRDESHRYHLDLISQADCTIVTETYFGNSNILNLEAANYADKLVLLGDLDVTERDYSGGRASNIYSGLRKRALVVRSTDLLEEIAQLLDMDLNY